MYLPSFIKTVFHYPLSQSMGYRLVCHQHSFFLSVARSPAFARYARTYPNSARRCLSSLLDRFGSFDPAVLQVSTAELGRFLLLLFPHPSGRQLADRRNPRQTCPPYQRSDLLRGFILCFHEFLQVLLWDTDDNGFHLSPLEPGTVDGLRRLLPIIASDTTREDGGRAFPVYLARIESGQAFTRQNSPDMNQGGRYRAYRNCEALRPGLSGTISPCVDNGALHYCSRVRHTSLTLYLEPCLTSLPSSILVPVPQRCVLWERSDLNTVARPSRSL